MENENDDDVIFVRETRPNYYRRNDIPYVGLIVISSQSSESLSVGDDQQQEDNQNHQPEATSLPRIEEIDRENDVEVATEEIENNQSEENLIFEGAPLR